MSASQMNHVKTSIESREVVRAVGIFSAGFMFNSNKLSLLEIVNKTYKITHRINSEKV